MATKKHNDELEGSYVLPRSLEISGMTKVYQEVLKLTEKTYKKFVLDAGEVALVDTAGIQFIVQLLLTLRSTGCEVSWENDSIQIYQMAAELGVDQQLEG